MAAYSLLSSTNWSTLKLSSLNQSPILLPSTPFPHFAIAGLSRRRRRSLIISGMQPSISESSPTARQDVRSSSSTISSNENSAITQTTSIAGLNLQMFSSANIPPWAKFALGSLLLLAIPFCTKAMRLQDAMKSAEAVVKTVEMVAEEAEKVAAEVAQVLPNGWLKDAVVELEKIALFVDKSAEVTESVIDKVEDVAEVFDTTSRPVRTGENVKLEVVEKEDKDTRRVMLAAESSAKEVIIGGQIRLNGGEEEDEVPTKDITPQESALL